MKIITEAIKFTELYKEIRDILLTRSNIPEITLIDSLAEKITKRLMYWELPKKNEK